MEKYIIINEFDNYAISNLGNIKNVKTGRVLKLCLNPRGYYSYTFYKKGIRKTFRIHRLVALYFIDNPNNLLEVNHIDNNKANNNVENLEWCNRLWNERCKTKHTSGYPPIPIIQVDKDNNIIAEFESASDCYRHLHHTIPYIHKYIKSNKLIYKNGIKYRLKYK